MHGEMNRNMAAANQMAIDMIVNQRALPLSRGNRTVRPQGRKYNSYTPEMRTRIAKYAMMAGDLEAAQHFSRELGHKVAVTSVWRFRKAYTRELKRLHQEETVNIPNVCNSVERKYGGVKRRGRTRGMVIDVASIQQGLDEQMEEGADCEWTPPTEAEMKVIQAKKERSDKISKLMGDYLLKGYRMLASTCSLCGTILLRDKQQQDYCVACSELDTEHAKDDPALSAEAARSQVREHELIRTSPSSTATHPDPAAQQMGDTSLTITNVCSGPEALRSQLQGSLPVDVTAHRVQLLSPHAPSHAPSPTPPSNPQATVLPQTAGSVLYSTQQQQQQAPVVQGPDAGGWDRNRRTNVVIEQSLDAVLSKMAWASDELGKSNSVGNCTSLCRLIQACAEAADSLKSAANN